MGYGISMTNEDREALDHLNAVQETIDSFNPTQEALDLMTEARIKREKERRQAAELIRREKDDKRPLLDAMWWRERCPK